MICTQIAEGEALVQICRADGMPNISTVYRWLAANEKFREMYQLARDDQADTLADQILAIADELPYTIKKDEGGQDVRVPIVLDAAAVERQRLRVEARKWIASKLKPKRYGDRQELVGAGGAPLIPYDPSSEWSEERKQLECAHWLAFIF